MDIELIRNLQEFVTFVKNMSHGGSAKDRRAVAYGYIMDKVGYILRASATLYELRLIDRSKFNYHYIIRPMNNACQEMYSLAHVDSVFYWTHLDLIDARKYYLFPEL